MDTLFQGLTVPTPCPHCGYAIEQPVGQPQRCTHCPRCTLALNFEGGPSPADQRAGYTKRTKRQHRPG
jgi:hypothetical protein